MESLFGDMLDLIAPYGYETITLVPTEHRAGEVHIVSGRFGVTTLRESKQKDDHCTIGVPEKNSMPAVLMAAGITAFYNRMEHGIRSKLSWLQ